MLPGKRKKSAPSTNKGRRQAEVVKRMLILEAKLGRPPSMLEIKRDHPALHKKILENFESVVDARTMVAIEQVRIENETASHK
jgi:hypothetical protein